MMKVIGPRCKSPDGARSGARAPPVRAIRSFDRQILTVGARGVTYLAETPCPEWRWAGRPTAFMVLAVVSRFMDMSIDPVYYRCDTLL